ncbi:MAG: S9 family peptidase, partial [Pyrinomonadaceae bacterium]|nr:S9 family peptidase [Phycisphaerales bacterium]
MLLVGIAGLTTPASARQNAASPAASVPAPAGRPIVYPPTDRENTVDMIHGTKVEDPYRWLEEADTPGSKVWPKVAAWVQAQNDVTFAYLNQIPGKEAIKARLTDLTNYERFGTPSKQGGKYFYSRNDGLQNQAVLYVADGKAEGKIL